MDWFGPHGPATALFALLVASTNDTLKTAPHILGVAAPAVAVSTVLHGATAYFAGRIFGEPGAHDP